MVFFRCLCNCDGCIVTRLGLVLVVDGNMSVTGRDDAGVAFARTFDFIKADQSPAKALSFITDVSVLFTYMCVCVCVWGGGGYCPVFAVLLVTWCAKGPISYL